MIYLASPYSHKERIIQEKRYLLVCQYAAKLIRKGIIVFSPIAHSHGIAQFGLSDSWEYWKYVDLWYIRNCSELWVLMIDGWTLSKGILEEVTIANLMEKYVRYVGLGKVPDDVKHLIDPRRALLKRKN